MRLQELSLVNFKNYHEAQFVFDETINCFVGPNGSGKTNILDAIHYLSLCKSCLNPIDSQNIKHNEDFFVVQGKFDQEEVEKVFCGVKARQKKQFKNNGKEYKRLADHIGKIPLVMISPYDTNLISEGSEDRRKFMDGVICQVNPNYLHELIAYNKVLQQRNALLKNTRPNQSVDLEVVGIYNDQLHSHGTKIHNWRQEFVEEFIPVFNSFYSKLSDDKEEVEITYESKLADASLVDLLDENLERDRILQRTTVGIHKDDLKFTIWDNPVKKFGSQGQQKTFLISLKLAEYNFLKAAKDFNPLLLLDDIFDKLDDQRVKRLMELVSNQTFGQIFVTDTSKKRVEDIFSTIDVNIKTFEVENGVVQTSPDWRIRGTFDSDYFTNAKKRIHIKRSLG